MSFTCLFIKDARILQHKSKARQFLFLDIKILKLSIFNVTKVNMNFFYHYMKNLTLLKWKISLRPNGFRLSNPRIPPPPLFFVMGTMRFLLCGVQKKHFVPNDPFEKINIIILFWLYLHRILEYFLLRLFGGSRTAPNMYRVYNWFNRLGQSIVEFTLGIIDDPYCRVYN